MDRRKANRSGSGPRKVARAGQFQRLFTAGCMGILPIGKALWIGILYPMLLWPGCRAERLLPGSGSAPRLAISNSVFCADLGVSLSFTHGGQSYGSEGPPGAYEMPGGCPEDSDGNASCSIESLSTARKVQASNRPDGAVSWAGIRNAAVNALKEILPG